MNKPRVLLTYIESGMGHIMSMKAIADSLKAKYSDKLDIIESYIMDEGSKATADFEKFLSGCTKKTNKDKAFGIGIFWFLDLMGKQTFMRFILMLQLMLCAHIIQMLLFLRIISLLLPL